MFNLDKIWKIFKPILSPIASPENLELAPFRELVEICDHFGYFITAKEMKEDENTVVELRVQLEDALFIQRGCDITTKIAKGHAATLLLKDLKVNFSSQIFIHRSLLFYPGFLSSDKT